MPPHREGDGPAAAQPGDGTAAKTPTSAERFKAERTGRPETPRETLREAVRQALAGAAERSRSSSPASARRACGSSCGTPRPVTSSATTVALPGDRNRDGEPVWFAGSNLAPDLSLPKIRLRLADGTAEPRTRAASRPPAGRTGRRPPGDDAAATGIAERAAVLLDGDDDEAAAQLVGVGELLDAVAQTSPAATRAELAAAARAFERATRSHIRAERADTRALRSAARGIIQAGSALGRGEDGGTTAMLALHPGPGRPRRRPLALRPRSRPAGRTPPDRPPQHLRAAYRQAAATPMRALRDQGRALPEAQRRTLRGHHPRRPARAGRPTRWRDARTDALVATLAQAEQAGHDPEALLQQAIDMRELDTAEDVNDVLVWRLRRLAQLPAHPGEAPVARRPAPAAPSLDQTAPATGPHPRRHRARLLRTPATARHAADQRSGRPATGLPDRAKPLDSRLHRLLRMNRQDSTGR